MLANLNLLLLTGQAGIECYIVDETNRVRLLDSADNRILQSFINSKDLITG